MTIAALERAVALYMANNSAEYDVSFGDCTGPVSTVLPKASMILYAAVVNQYDSARKTEPSVHTCWVSASATKGGEMSPCMDVNANRCLAIPTG